MSLRSWVNKMFYCLILQGMKLFQQAGVLAEETAGRNEERQR